MFATMLDHALAAPVDARHPYKTWIIDMVGKILMDHDSAVANAFFTLQISKSMRLHLGFGGEDVPHGRLVAALARACVFVLRVC
jgi:hypothetical protein